jgi:hypothetical protein
LPAFPAISKSISIKTSKQASFTMVLITEWSLQRAAWAEKGFWEKYFDSDDAAKLIFDKEVSALSAQADNGNHVHAAAQRHLPRTANMKFALHALGKMTRFRLKTRIIEAVRIRSA